MSHFAFSAAALITAISRGSLMWRNRNSIGSAFTAAATSSMTPARAAAKKHSSVSASIPLIMTLRTILIAAAAPTSTPATLARMPSAARTGATVVLAGPASSKGVCCRAG